MGGAGRRRRAAARARRARLLGRARRAARAGRARAARGRARRGDRRAATRRRPTCRGRRPATRTSRGSESSSQGPSGRCAIVGEGGWTPQTAADVLAFCEANRIPGGGVVPLPGLRRQPLRGLRRPPDARAWTRSSRARVEDADLILALGGRLGEVTTRGYTLLEAPRPRQTLVHAHPDPDELGRVYEAELPIVSALPELAAALGRLAPVDASRWEDWARGRACRLPGEPRPPRASRRPRSRRGDGVPPAAAAGRRDRHLRRGQLHRLGAPLLRVLAATRRSSRRAPARWATGCRPRWPRRCSIPARLAVCLAGDGDFMMSAAELATAVQYGLDRDRSRGRTTACTGRSACTRSGSIPGASSAPTSSTPTSPTFARVVRLPRRDGRADRGRRGRVRARRRVGQAGRDRPARRPEAIHPRFTIARLRASA